MADFWDQDEPTLDLTDSPNPWGDDEVQGSDVPRETITPAPTVSRTQKVMEAATGARKFLMGTNPEEEAGGEYKTGLLPSVRESIQDQRQATRKALKRLPGNIVDSAESQLAGAWAGLKHAVADVDAGMASAAMQTAQEETARTGQAPTFTLAPNASEDLGQAELRQGTARRAYERASAQAQAAMPADAGPIEKAVQQGLASAAVTVPIVTLGAMVPGGQIPALLALGGQSAADRYGQLRSQGIDSGSAALSSSAMGGLEVLTEKIPLGSLAKKTPFVRKSLEFLITDLLGENVTSLAQLADDYRLQLRDDVTMADIKQSIQDTTGATIVGAGAQMGVTGLLEHVLAKANERAEAREIDPENLEAQIQADADAAMKRFGIDLPTEPEQPKRLNRPTDFVSDAEGVTRRPGEEKPAAKALPAPRKANAFVTDSEGNTVQLTEADARKQQDALYERAAQELELGKQTLPGAPRPSISGQNEPGDEVIQPVAKSVPNEPLSLVGLTKGKNGWVINVNGEPGPIAFKSKAEALAEMGVAKKALASPEALAEIRALSEEVEPVAKPKVFTPEERLNRDLDVAQVLGQEVQKPAEPTPAQAEAGNYRKPVVKWNGLDIRVENIRGSERSGTDESGKKWRRVQKADYGYISRTEAKDGEAIDVYLGDQPDAKNVYVIDQLTPDGVAYDEAKAVIGVTSKDAAQELYLKHYPKDWKGLGAITVMSAADFKTWAKTGNTTAPVAWRPPAPRKAPKFATANPRTDSILEFVTKSTLHDAASNGLNLDELVSEGLDPAELKTARGVGIRRPFTKGGATLDQMAEALGEAGYPVLDKEGNYDKNRVLDLITQEIRQGKRVVASEEALDAEIEKMAEKVYGNPVSDEALEQEDAELTLARLEAMQERLAITEEAERAKEEEDDDEDYIPFQRKGGGTGDLFSGMFPSRQPETPAAKPASQPDLFGDKVAIQNEIIRLKAALAKKRAAGGKPSAGPDLFGDAKDQIDLTETTGPKGMPGDVDSQPRGAQGQQQEPKDVRRPSNDPQPDTGGQPAQPVGQGSLLAPGAEEAGRPGGASQNAGENGRPAENRDGVPGGRAVAGGEQSDLPFHSEDGEFGPAESPAGGDERRGGDSSRGDGQADDDSGATDTREDAEAARPRIDRDEKLRLQRAAESLPTIPGDAANIAESLPFLLPSQHEDVHKAEVRLNRPEGYGMLFTNGTGTGKTYVGLGYIKRMVKRGKGNGIVVVPSQKIADDWRISARDLGLELHLLDGLNDGGKGVSITTYANFGDNRLLADREYDFVIADEAHMLMQSGEAKQTAALDTLRALTYHPGGVWTRAQMEHRDVYDVFDKAQAEERLATKEHRPPNVLMPLQQNLRLAHAAWQGTIQGMRERFKATTREKRPRALFLSATPFAYEKNIQWAEGYLFEYPPENTSGRYNAAGGYNAFMMQHFGYRMRTGKLTEPGPEVDRDIMQRQFNTWLRQEGAIGSRVLDVDHDYDRKFVMVESMVGNKIDEGLNWLRDAEERRFWPIHGLVMKRFDHLKRSRLLQSLKAEESVDYIKKQHALGRKVVVFYDYNEGGSENVFDIDPDVIGDEQIVQVKGDKSMKLKDLVKEFREKRPDLVELNTQAPNPLITLKRAFPDLAEYNGRVSTGKRIRGVRNFNNDALPEANLIMAQKAANAGWSGHDTTGKHQRVLINLGLPTAPTVAIQQEGRIYRVGQESDALFRYFNTGTSWERYAFATTIARRAGTAENLAMGEQARGLRDAFIQAFEESDTEVPGGPTDGKGGKARDRALVQAISDFDRAKALYFGQQKKTSRTKAAEGTDYFATPEPLGLKMVEWGRGRPSDAFLEPSAGHGAIARWFPELQKRTVIEPSQELASRLALTTDAHILQQRFEDLHVINKADVIVMNPPFGSGGRTAIDHLAKAVTHLEDGGRIVAIIPEGPSADAKFDKWMDSEEAEGVYLVRQIDLPNVTFERAGTSVKTRVVILDKLSKRAEKAGAHLDQRGRIDLNAETVADLFAALENLEAPDRPVIPGITPVADIRGPDQTITAPPMPSVTPVAGLFASKQFPHTKTGAPVYIAQFTKRVDREEYEKYNALAKGFGGWYNRYVIQGFAFRTSSARDAFLAKATGNTSFLRQRRPVTGLLEREVRGQINQLLRRFALRPMLTVVQDFDDLPAATLEKVRASGGIRGEVKAFYSDGGIYFIANEFQTPAEVTQALLHEYVVHFGLRTLPDEVRATILDGVVRDNREAINRMGFQEFGESWDPQNLTMQRRAADELLAYYGQQYLDGNTIPTRIKRWLDRLIAAFQDLIRGIHGLGPTFNETYIRGMLQDLQEHLRTGDKDVTLEDGEIVFQRHDKPFYSGLLRAIETAKRDKGTAAEWMGTLRNMPGVKQEEISWVGIEEWLAGQGRVDKASVADFVRVNQVEVQDVMHGFQGNTARESIDRAVVELTALGYMPIFETGAAGNEELDALRHESSGGYYRPDGGGDWFLVDDDSSELSDVMLPEDARLLAEIIREEAFNAVNELADSEEGGTRYGNYQLPGGENYRELLLTMPASQFDPAEVRELVNQLRMVDTKIIGLKHGTPAWAKTEEEAHALRKRLTELTGDPYGRPKKASGARGRPDEYRSSHWSEPNILAHVRFNDRTDADGKRVLFLEELQSDWGQGNRRAMDQILKPDSVRKLGYDVFGREVAAMMSLEAMDGGVLASLEHDQVLRAVVASLPVDVVDLLARNQLSAEKIFSNSSVVVTRLSTDHLRAVANGLIGAMRGVGASLRAKLLDARQAGRDGNLLPALKASDLNSREVVGLLAPERIYHDGLSGGPVLGDVAGSGAVRGPSPTDIAGRSSESDAAVRAGSRDNGSGASVGAKSSSRSAWPDQKGSSASITDILNWHTKILREAGKSQQARYMPAPFVGGTESWATLAFRRMIRYAAENGYERIAWTPGDVQIDRYASELRQHVDEIGYEPQENGTWDVLAHKADRRVFEREEVDEEFLREHFGEDIADLIVSDKKPWTPNPYRDWRFIKGDNLAIGGTGFRGFYDQILPATVNKMVKKWGARVGKTTIDIRGGKPTQYADFGDYAAKKDSAPTQVHSLDVTESMRAAAMEGLPLFQRHQAMPLKLHPTQPSQKSGYAALADRIIDTWNEKIGWRYGPLGKLPDKDDYLLERYKTLGNITESREIARGIFDALSKASPEDSQRVFEYLTTRDYSPTEIVDGQIRNTAMRAKALIDEQGQRLVDAGLLSEESHDEYAGRYLPRMYLKHVLGDGMYAEMGSGMKVSRQGNLKFRDNSIPREIRDVILGEIKDPAFLASFGLSRTMRDLAMIDFLQTVSKNKKWVAERMLVEWNGRNVSPFWMAGEAKRLRKQADFYKDHAIAQKARDIADHMDSLANRAMDRLERIDLSEYKQVPDTNRYGGLRGLWVREEVYEDLVGTQNFIEPGTFESIVKNYAGGFTRFWKSAHVGWNVPSHFRNMSGNTIMLHLSGVPMHRVYSGELFIKAINSIVQKDQFWQIAKKYGMKESTFANVELARIRDEWIMLQDSKDTGVNKAHAMFGKLTNAIGDIYQFEEALFKIAKLRDAMEREGMAEDKAMLEAHKWIFDYSLVPRWVRYMRNAPLGIPFLTFTYKAFPRMAETLIRKPYKYLPYFAVGLALSEAIQFAFDVDDDDLEKLKNAMPSWMRTRGSMYLWPFKDSAGRWQMLDVGYIVPWGMLGDVAAQIGEGEYRQAAGTVGLFSGPIPDAIAAYQTGIDPFTQRRIMNPSDPPAEQAKQLLKYMWGMAAPGWLTPQGWAGQVTDLATGKVDPRTGDLKLTAGQVFMRLFGLNFYPADPETTRTRNLKFMQYDIEDIKDRMRSQLRDRNLSPSDKTEIRETYRKLMEEKQEELREYRESSEIHPNLKTTSDESNIETIGSLIEGKNKTEAVKSLSESGYPALAGLINEMPAKPRPAVASALADIARAS